MRAFKKLSVMLLACLLIVSVSGKTAFAASGTISLSDPTAAVGESVSVTVKVTTTDSSKIGSVTMELTYDPKILDFEEGTSATNEDGIVKISGTADSAIKTYTLTFKALSSGTSAIKISSYDIQDSKEATIEMSKVGSSTVTITGDTTTTDTQTQDSTTTDGQTEDATATDAQTEEVKSSIEDKIVDPPKKDVEVEIAGTPFYICKITKDIIPEGFEYIGYKYEGKAVDAVRKDNVVLFYLNQIGEQPYIFYLYDEETEGFFQYAPVTPSLEYSVIGADESVQIPEGFTQADVSVGGVAVTGWQSNNNSEYYLLYLMTSEGKKNLYLYDAVEKTVQRYYYSNSEDTAQTDSYQEMYTELNANYNADMQSKTRFIYTLIIIAVILVFIIINLALRLLDKRHHIVEDEDEEEDYDYIEEEYNDSDDFEDEDDDYEDEIEVKSDRKLKKEMEKAAKLEKKEMIKKEKAAKKMKKASKEELEDEFENEEDDFDDSDDFEMQIFDLNEDKK